jgi:hypothetical protein
MTILDWAMCHPEGEIFTEKHLAEKPKIYDNYLVTFTGPYTPNGQGLLNGIKDKGFIKVSRHFPDFSHLNLRLVESPLKITREGFIRRSFLVESPISEEASKFIIQSHFREILEGEDLCSSFEIKKIVSFAAV